MSRYLVSFWPWKRLGETDARWPQGRLARVSSLHSQPEAARILIVDCFWATCLVHLRSDRIGVLQDVFCHLLFDASKVNSVTRVLVSDKTLLFAKFLHRVRKHRVASKRAGQRIEYRLFSKSSVGCSSIRECPSKLQKPTRCGARSFKSVRLSLDRCPGCVFDGGVPQCEKIR